MMAHVTETSYLRRCDGNIQTMGRPFQPGIREVYLLDSQQLSVGVRDWTILSRATLLLYPGNPAAHTSDFRYLAQNGPDVSPQLALFLILWDDEVASLTRYQWHAGCTETRTRVSRTVA